MLLLYGISSGVYVILTVEEVLARSAKLLPKRGFGLPYRKWSLVLLEALAMTMMWGEHQIPTLSTFLRHISMSP